MVLLGCYVAARVSGGLLGCFAVVREFGVVARVLCHC